MTRIDSNGRPMIVPAQAKFIAERIGADRVVIIATRGRVVETAAWGVPKVHHDAILLGDRLYEETMAHMVRP